MSVRGHNVRFTSDPIFFCQVVKNTEISANLLLWILIVDGISESEGMELLCISKLCLAFQFKVMNPLQQSKNTNIIRYRRWTSIHNPLAYMCFARLISVKTHIGSMRSRLEHILLTRCFSTFYSQSCCKRYNSRIPFVWLGVESDWNWIAACSWRQFSFY